MPRPAQRTPSTKLHPERSSALRPASNGPSLGALVLSAALLPLFLHSGFQPSVDAGSVTLRLADLAVLAVAAAALYEGRRVGFARLRAGRWIWFATAAFFAVVAVSMVAALASSRTYPFGDHLVTAAKYAEYALLALAVPLVVRRREDSRPVFATVALLSVLASAVGVLQLVGVPFFQEWPAGRRQPSFLGHHDFAALSGAALMLAYATIALGEASPRVRRLAAASGVSGALGLVVSGAVTGVAGLFLAAIMVALVARRLGTLTRRRAAVIAVTVCVVLAGVLAIRSANIAEFLEDEPAGSVETFSHRGVLAYIGIREFAGHPLLGVGWQASLDEAGYGPYLDDARRRYPDQPERVFPSRAEPWGVQNAYLQALADMGAVGGLALAALIVAAFATGLATALRARAGSAALAFALVGTLWLCIVTGIWNGIGLIAGLPLDALFWLALGFTATAAAGAADE
jgi:O-antigen ligase